MNCWVIIFERRLKENNLSGDIYNLRIAFPVQRTTEQGKSVSYLTTTDGLAVLNRRRGNPGAWLTTVAGINPGDFAKINLATDALEDYLDALGDLLLAESIYPVCERQYRESCRSSKDHE